LTETKNYAIKEVYGFLFHSLLSTRASLKTCPGVYYDFEVFMLTQKQENFVNNLFKGMTQREAWIQAGYSSKYALTLIDSHACRLAKRDKIQARLEELRNEASSHTVMTEIQRKERLSEFAKANLVDFISEDGQVSLSKDIPNYGAATEYAVKRTKHGYNRSLKLLNPISAIDLLNKMDGLYDEGRPVRDINIVFVIGKGYQDIKELEVGDAPE